MKTNHTKLTAERLREALHYDPMTGVFTRIHRTSKSTHVGDIAGTMSRGYLVFQLDGCQYHAHRLAFLYVFGDWPTEQIDHINGVRSDNRIANLRNASNSVNLQNQRPARSKNKSGLLGAHWDGPRGLWQAKIKLDGKTHFLGRFSTTHEAHAAYLDAKRLLHPGCTI